MRDIKQQIPRFLFEIVGIYSNTDGATNEALQPNWSYSDATVFLLIFFPCRSTCRAYVLPG